MPLVCIAPPVVDPVDFDEAKLHARIDDDRFDGLLPVWIRSARESAEHQTGRAYGKQLWELRLDAFPGGAIKLCKPPVTDIVSISYTDANGAEQTMDPAEYLLDAAPLHAWVRLAHDAAWPTTRAEANAVRVRFRAGTDDVPAAVRQWMLLQIGAAVKQSEAFASGFAVAELPNRWVDALLDAERIGM